MKILIVEDDVLLQLTLKKVFREYDCTFVSNYADAEKALNEKNFIAAFLDIQLEGASEKNGIDLLSKIQKLDFYLPCIMISGIDDPKVISQCIEMGAVDYVAKGTINPEGYHIALLKALQFRKLKAESKRQVETVFINQSDNPSLIKGKSKQIEKLKAQLKTLSTMPGPFLILGETGTGKELVAKELWLSKAKSHRPFIAVNCASLPENLVESELFGYEKGAFTGALTAKAGLFEAANGGDIFLDEMGDLSLDLQAKLLRVLQEKKVRRLGSEKERPIDFRVIAATNINLHEAVEKKEFREDLFYRLNVFTIKLAPLRERKDDIAVLLEEFLTEYGLHQVQIQTQALENILSYPWPGNVRQLKAFALSILPQLITNKIITKDVFDSWLLNQSHQKIQPKAKAIDTQGDVKNILSQNEKINIDEILQQTRKNYVMSVLEFTQNNRTQAAKLLGITRQRLANWLNEWGVY